MTSFLKSVLNTLLHKDTIIDGIKFSHNTKWKKYEYFPEEFNPNKQTLVIIYRNNCNQFFSPRVDKINRCLINGAGKAIKSSKILAYQIIDNNDNDWRTERNSLIDSDNYFVRIGDSYHHCYSKDKTLFFVSGSSAEVKNPKRWIKLEKVL